MEAAGIKSIPAEVYNYKDITWDLIKNIQSIPKGKVATYKQIAELAGKPQGSRGVAWILNSCSTKYKLHWHRVLNSQGRISFEKNSYNFREQKRRLEKEGVEFISLGGLQLTKFQWKKRGKKNRPTKKRPNMFG